MLSVCCNLFVIQIRLQSILQFEQHCQPCSSWFDSHCAWQRGRELIQAVLHCNTCQASLVALQVLHGNRLSLSLSFSLSLYALLLWLSLPRRLSCNCSSARFAICCMPTFPLPPPPPSPCLPAPMRHKPKLSRLLCCPFLRRRRRRRCRVCRVACHKSR